MEGNAAAVFEQRYDGEERFALFNLTPLFGRLSRVNGHAGTAADPLALVDRTAYGRSTFQLKGLGGSPIRSFPPSLNRFRKLCPA